MSATKQKHLPKREQLASKELQPVEQKNYTVVLFFLFVVFAIVYTYWSSMETYSNSVSYDL